MANPVLRRGDCGAAVSRLQQALADLGLQVTADGVFGAGTEAAVKELQSRHGLRADGVVGEQTWLRVNGAAAAAPGDRSPMSDSFQRQTEQAARSSQQQPTAGRLMRAGHGRTSARPRRIPVPARGPITARSPAVPEPLSNKRIEQLQDNRAAAIADAAADGARRVVVPDTGFGRAGTLVRWTKPPGEPVEDGEPLGTVEIDVAEFELFAPAPGTFAKPFAEPGETVVVGQPVAALAPRPADSRSGRRLRAFSAVVRFLRRERPGDERA